MATNSNSRTSNALGLKWLQEHFELATRLKNGGHQFFILDDHGSYLILEFQDFYKQYKIVLLCLPSHTSHILQPLDFVVFLPLKHCFR